MTGLADIAAAVEIAAPIERVWTCLTDEGLVAHWLGCLAFKAELGSVFYMQHDRARRAAGDLTGATHCEIEALEPPRRIRFSWFMPGTPKTHVEIVLAETPGGVTARLLHAGWDQFDANELRSVHEMLSGGWRSFVLPGLKQLAEAA